MTLVIHEDPEVVARMESWQYKWGKQWVRLILSRDFGETWIEADAMHFPGTTVVFQDKEGERYLPHSLGHRHVNVYRQAPASDPTEASP